MQRNVTVVTPDIEEANTLYQRGLFYLDSGLTEDAIDVLTQVTELAPDSPRAWAALAEAQERAGLATAAVSKAKALDLQAQLTKVAVSDVELEDDERIQQLKNGRVFEVRGPGQVIQHAQREVAEAGGGMTSDADIEVSSSTMPDVAPNVDEATTEHAINYRQCSEAGDWGNAAKAAQAIIDLRPGDSMAWGSLGIALRYQFQLDAAVDAHRRAAELAPDVPAYLGAYAKSCWEAGRYEESLAPYSGLLRGMEEDLGEATESDPVYADTRLASAMLTMLRGDLAVGLEDYEWRWKTGKIELPSVQQPQWDGNDASGKTVLFYGEQGFGDAIQFARFIPLMAARCGKVLVPCKPAVKRLLSSIPGNVEVTDETIRRDSFDQYVPAMSTMRVFGMGAENIPASVRYLAADEEDISKFQGLVDAAVGRYGKNPKSTLKIGVAWTGSPTNTISWKKTIDPSLFNSLLEAKDTAFFSLQVMRDDMPDTAKHVPDGMVDLAPYLDDFADTAAAIECLDLVITVDTAVAHLAGALGKPVWNMLPFVPDWRWFLNRADSPWYPTMRLFRQKTPGDWRAVMVDVAAALRSVDRPKNSLFGRLLGGDD